MQPLRNLGEYIRDQRNISQISLRQLAMAAGVSNPYLSQIERGLRKPSAEILQQIARALRISAEALYVQAGILDERIGGAQVAEAIHAEGGLSERQKQVLLEIYDSFRRENDGSPAAGSAPSRASSAPAAPATPSPPSAPAARAAEAQAKKAAKSPAKKAAKSPAKAAAKSTTKSPAKSPAKKAAKKAPTKRSTTPS